MISPKALQMIEVLSSSEDYISQETLSYKLSVKPRTLREILRIYKEEIEAGGACAILYKNNYGYLLEIQDKDIFAKYLETQKDELRKEQWNNPVTVTERAEYIIRHLLLSSSPMKSDELCEMLNISRSTMAQVLKLVRSILIKYTLSLEVKGKQGLYIETEIVFRISFPIISFIMVKRKMKMLRKRKHGFMLFYCLSCRKMTTP